MQVYLFLFIKGVSIYTYFGLMQSNTSYVVLQVRLIPPSISFYENIIFFIESRILFYRNNIGTSVESGCGV
jgi:hypothetical protein